MNKFKRTPAERPRHFGIHLAVNKDFSVVSNVRKGFTSSRPLKGKHPICVGNALNTVYWIGCLRPI
jgi:hypothetical protein